MPNHDNVIEITETHKEETTVLNALVSTLRRADLSAGFGISPDGKRDYNTIFGYGTTLSYKDFYGMYDRSGYANTIVEKVAKACWGEIPKIKKGETQILETELKQLAKMGFFSALQRADILNRIGNFSVLLIGLPDGQDLDQPLGSAGKKLKNMYFNPYNYDGITISKFDTDPASPRFQLPEIYQLQTSNTGDKSKDVSFQAFNVHWSRVVHLAEGALDSRIEGRSALRAPWNALIDAEKVRGGSGEAYFKNARQVRALEADKDANLDPTSGALDTLKENLQAFDNGWDSTLRLQNMKAKNLTVELASPRDSNDVIVETLSGQTGIPIRVFTGKGGGQTSGAEDRASWNALISDRRVDFCDGVLFDGLEIMASAGLFDLPDDVEIEWSPQSATTEKDQSAINKTKAETFKIVVDAASTPVGDETDLDTLLDVVGLGDIEIDTSAIESSEPEPEEDLPDDNDPPE